MTKTTETTTTTTKVIVCTGRDGQAVVYGTIQGDTLPGPGENVRITGAKMVLYWAGEKGLFGLAQTGPEPGSRLTSSVKETTCTVRQALLVSPEAAERIEGWPDAQ